MGNLCGSTPGAVRPDELPPKPAQPTRSPSPAPTPRPMTGDGQPPITRAVTPRPKTQAGLPEQDDDSTMRLLLLGAAEAGKTTLLAQIRIVYKQNYTEAELFHRKIFIYSNIMRSIQKLICFLKDEGISFSSPENSGHAQNLMLEEYHNSRFTPEQERAILSIWNDPVVQDAYKKRSAFNLNDSTRFFIENFARINDVNYTPTPADLIMSYVPTVGVQNVIFTANNKTFQLFDIGGQRIDRRKWATMYDGIDAIFFCMAISEYDQVMVEDMKTNRLEDSMNLLEKISKEPKFSTTPIFLFLNEIDVFKQKLAVFPLEDFLPDYNGTSPDDAINFIEEMARIRIGRTDKNLLHVYRTVMVDTSKMSKMLHEIFKKYIK